MILKDLSYSHYQHTQWEIKIILLKNFLYLSYIMYSNCINNNKLNNIKINIEIIKQMQESIFWKLGNFLDLMPLFFLNSRAASLAQRQSASLLSWWSRVRSPQGALRFGFFLMITFLIYTLIIIYSYKFKFWLYK